MSNTNYAPQRYTVLENKSAENNYGSAVQAGDFKTRVVELITADSLDGELVVYESNQELPPDISAPVTPTNEYYAVGYSKASDQTYLDTDNPFNPAGEDGTYVFNVETTGSVWIFAAVLNRTAGTVAKLNINLFDNQ